MHNFRVLVLGANGLVGSSIVRTLKKSNKVKKVFAATRKDANLFSLTETQKLISKVQPNILINAAAKVGGIHANNTKRSSFIIDNLKININVYESCIPFPKIKIINLGSSCIYPLNAKNPIKEEYMMTGKLESTNSPYAMSKLAAIEIADAIKKDYGHNVINLMPTNLYGPNDNFSEYESHVIPGLITRMHNAKIKNSSSFKIWGTGKPLREFLHVDDLSNAVEFLLDKEVDYEILNVGSGEEISILNLAELVKDILHFKGELVFDTNMPDGNPRKLIDSRIINKLGWKPKISLKNGITNTYKWYLENN